MATQSRLETLGALRATHEAIRLAREVGYPPIDVGRVCCEGCKRELDWYCLGQGFELTCPACGHAMALPLHLRGLVTTPVTRWPPPGPWDGILSYATPAEPPLALLGGILVDPPDSGEDLSIPPWLMIVLSAAFLTVVVTAVVVISELK